MNTSVPLLAATFGFIIEEERGTSHSTAASPHRHNGYHGGTFAAPANPDELVQWFAWGRAESARIPA